MHDDKDQISHEDEYQFPEDEFIQGESTGRPSTEVEESLEQQAKSAQRERMMKIYEKIREVLSNRIVAAVLVVIFLLILAHFYFGGSTKKSVQQAPVQQQQPVQQPVQVTQPSAQVLSQLSSIKQSESTTSTTIQQLQNQIQSLQSSIGQMTQNKQQYEGALTSLAQKVNSLQAQQQKMMTAAKKPAKAEKAAMVIPPVNFYTRAVVHNRAWVIGSNGMNASIAVGDHLKDYGKILSINANNGVITTSSGRVIRYAPGDS